MFDHRLRRLIDRPLDGVGGWLAGRGVGADHVTLTGLLVGLAAAVAIACKASGLALILVILNRVADGIDGAVARATTKTDRGGYLDITCDFAFYAAVPLAFAVAEPAQNGLAAATLLAAFLGNGTAFLAFALMAERHGLSTEAQGQKSLYYIAGLAEGGETIVCFVAMCLLPAWFPSIAYTFAALCVASAVARVALGARLLARR